ncbi:unnamed protein product [Sympodiomycopsis kandeliae]
MTSRRSQSTTAAALQQQSKRSSSLAQATSSSQPSTSGNQENENDFANRDSSLSDLKRSLAENTSIPTQNMASSSSRPIFHSSQLQSQADPDSSTSTVARSPQEEEGADNAALTNGHGHEDSDDDNISRKRRRTNSNNRRVESDTEQDEDQDGEQDVKPKVKAELNGEGSQDHDFDLRPATQLDPEDNAAMRDGQGYLPGSIVRVALSNFVTYESVEFFPGPHLNMIIGPNGTGKSTIVCAIALGLGWKPGVLGRAKDVASYVKQGYDKGWIEIELKAPLGQNSNIVIRRFIERDNNSSDWRINGKKATAKDVQAQVGQFDVSLDNLCCFLPQDRVADFARLDPASLLVETQRAAGHKDLSKWHEELIEWDKRYRDLNEAIKVEKEHRLNLEQRNAVAQRDVTRYEQRQRIEQEVEMLQLQIPFAHYKIAKDRYDECKTLRNQKKQELAALKEVHRPLEAKVQDLKDKKNKFEHRRSRAQEQVTTSAKDILKLEQHIEQIDGETSDLQSTLENLKDREKEQQKLIASLKNQVAQLHSKVQEEPEQADTADIDMKIRKCRTAARDAEGRIRELKDQRNEIGSETDDLHRTQDDTLGKLKRLDDARARRLDALKTADFACWKAVMWLRGNQNLFKKKVYEPVLLEVNVPDTRYVASVESCLNFVVLKTFFCQTRADYDLLTSQLVDKQNLRINVSENEGGATLPQLEDKRSLTLEQIRSLGFDDYIANLIEAPEPMMDWLCSKHFLHLIPVSLSDTSVNAEQVERNGNIKRYIAGTSNHTITFSQYGNRLAQTLSRDIGAPRILGQSTNQGEKDALENKMRDIAAELKDAEERVGGLNEQIASEREKIEKQNEARGELEGQRADAQQARKVWEKTKIDLTHKRNRLESELNRPSSQQERKRIDRKISDLTAKRSKLALEMRDLLLKQVDLKGAQDIAQLGEMQHEGNYQAWKELLQSKDTIYKSAERALNEAQDEFEDAKTEAKACGKTAQAKIDDARQDLAERFAALQNELKDAGEEMAPLAELEQTLVVKLDALNMASGVPTSVIEKYNRMKAEIDSLGETIAVKVRDAEKLGHKINETRGKWYPALKKLVESVSSKFSPSFDRIGCAGEVLVKEQPDGKYEEWGIEIRVKFRESESLQTLTGQRQSGGERSLSTILYLMSLTELSRSPFSLVDEINQGMDQRAERAVHDQMVEVTCKENSSQYFLITPKLLPDLKYHERMKVLIINNGEWIPEKLDLRKYVNKRPRAIATASREASVRA